MGAKAHLLPVTRGVVVEIVQPAFADVCYDLWYERNSIYNDNGYCFNTREGRRTFDNSDCYTDYPDFTRREQRRINQIKRQENDYGC